MRYRAGLHGDLRDSEAKKIICKASATKRHENWRDDWSRCIDEPVYDSGNWIILAMTMVAAHSPSHALFKLEYDQDNLLCSVEFISQYSQAPSRNWEPDGPELAELVSQITEIYIRRWEDS